jgi:uncharacterized protein YtpQ (UPF0354 family)
MPKVNSSEAGDCNVFGPIMARRHMLSGLAGFFALAVEPVPSWAQDQPMRAFRDEVLAVLRQRFPDKSFEQTDDDATIKQGDVIFGLGNLFAIVRDLSGNARQDTIAKYFAQSLAVRATNPSATSWADAAKIIRPRLFPVDYLKTKSTLLHRDFSRDVVIGYSLDHGNFDEYVDDDQTKHWQITTDVIHTAAIANLEELSRAVAIEATGGATGYFVTVHQGDAYDAARLLLPEFRARVISKLGDFAYAGIPNRDFLVFWSKDFAARAGFIEQIAKDVQRRPYPLTNEIFVATPSGVRVATAEEIAR